MTTVITVVGLISCGAVVGLLGGAVALVWYLQKDGGIFR